MCKKGIEKQIRNSNACKFSFHREEFRNQVHKSQGIKPLDLHGS